MYAMALGGRTSDRPGQVRDLASNLEVLDGLLNTLTVSWSGFGFANISGCLCQPETDLDQQWSLQKRRWRRKLDCD